MEPWMTPIILILFVSIMWVVGLTIMTIFSAKVGDYVRLDDISILEQTCQSDPCFNGTCPCFNGIGKIIKIIPSNEIFEFPDYTGTIRETVSRFERYVVQDSNMHILIGPSYAFSEVTKPKEK